MTRAVLPLMLVLLGACASSSGRMTESVGIASATVRSGEGTGAPLASVQVTTQPGTGSVTLDAPADRVWALLPAVFLELGIPLSQTDPALKLLVASNQRVTRIGGKRLSTYFRCGGVYGDNADSGNTFVTARAQVSATPEGKTLVRTEVRAAAAAEGTTVGECGSTGLLEKAIGEAIQAKSAAAP